MEMSRITPRYGIHRNNVVSDIVLPIVDPEFPDLETPTALESLEIFGLKEVAEVGYIRSAAQCD